jgi:hypothetical protein
MKSSETNNVDSLPHISQDGAAFDLANVEQGLRGCDAIYPYDQDQAYHGLHEWAELLIADRKRLLEQYENAETSTCRHCGLAGSSTCWCGRYDDREVGKNPTSDPASEPAPWTTLHDGVLDHIDRKRAEGSSPASRQDT